jgi:hypothetical protein
VGFGARFFDYDNDGDIDVLVTNNGSGLQLLRNDGGNRKNWLALKLVGTKSNRDGIGALITARAGGRPSVIQVQRAASYLSSHDPRAHFGLGEVEEVSELEIEWPSGIRQKIFNVRANQILTIEEAGQEENANP